MNDEEILLTVYSSLSDLWYYGAKKENWLSTYEGNVLERDILPLIGDKCFSDLESRDIEELQYICLKENQKAWKANQIRHLISELIRFGQTRFLIRANPASEAKKYAPEQVVSEGYTYEQWRKLLNSMRALDVNSIFEFQHMTGLQMSEVQYARISCYEQKDHSLIIGGDMTLRRKIWIPDASVDCISQAVCRTCRLRMKNGNKWRNMPDYIFISDHGNPFSNPMLQYYAKKIRDHSDLPMYSFERSTDHMISQVLSDGASEVDVMHYFGFTSPDQVLRKCRKSGFDMEGMNSYYEDSADCREITGEEIDMKG